MELQREVAERLANEAVKRALLPRAARGTASRHATAAAHGARMAWIPHASARCDPNRGPHAARTQPRGRCRLWSWTA